jgi:hypothetical protein
LKLRQELLAPFPALLYETTLLFLLLLHGLHHDVEHRSVQGEHRVHV